jgi:hypothetical protein
VRLERQSARRRACCGRFGPPSKRLRRLWARQRASWPGDATRRIQRDRASTTGPASPLPPRGVPGRATCRATLEAPTWGRASPFFGRTEHVCTSEHHRARPSACTVLIPSESEGTVFSSSAIDRVDPVRHDHLRLRRRHFPLPVRARSGRRRRGRSAARTKVGTLRRATSASGRGPPGSA